MWCTRLPSLALARSALGAAALSAASLAAQAAITLTPSTHDFGNVEVGQTIGPIRVTLTNEPSTGSDPILLGMANNVGTGPGTLSASSVGGCAFGSNLMRGDACVFDVSLEVTGTGPISRAIQFNLMGWTPDPMTVTFTANGVPVGTGPVAVPTMGAVGLGAMSLMLGGAGWFAARRRRQRQG